MDASEFVCFYCGEIKSAAESSDEHIIPSCIGGNRNLTLTEQVCTGCNSFMGEKVDRPFCRDWFIETARLLAGVAHRGKRPTIFMGQIEWSRSEKVELYLLEDGAHILVIDGVDGQRRLAIGLDDKQSAMVATVKKVIKNKFPGFPVVNDASPHTAYECELAVAVSALASSYRVNREVSVVAWHREIVKMALGLACQALGSGYISSPGAVLLRQFVREEDAEKRERIPLAGHAGLGPNATPTLTGFWHPGGDEHLLALISTGDKIGFAVNLFGKYENLVQVDATGAFNDGLSGSGFKGICWIVDPEAKTTSGPMPVEALLKRPPT